MLNDDKLLANISKLESVIGYTFKDKSNIILALTHSSFANENKALKLYNNERIEFLGDAVLNVVISEYIYNNYKDLSEGELTKLRANIVCESSLMKCANKIGLGKFLLLGKGEEASGGRERASMLCDVFEAVIGAIYLDGGMESAKAFIFRQMKSLIENSVKVFSFADYKTRLQEIVQKSTATKIRYVVVEEKGPDHDKVFVINVKVNNKVVGVGEGKSKKEAEQNAAKDAIESGLINEIQGD